jgi:hypothetical protein
LIKGDPQPDRNKTAFKSASLATAAFVMLKAKSKKHSQSNG